MYKMCKTRKIFSNNMLYPKDPHMSRKKALFMDISREKRLRGSSDLIS